MKNIHIFWLGLSILFGLSPQSLAQTKAPLPSHHQQIVQKFMALIGEGDICALLEHCEIPPLPKMERRSFFTTPSREQTEARLQSDKLLRHYLDRLKELILVFHRLNISNKSRVIYSPIPPAGSQDRFITEIEIKTPPSPLAATISPDFAEKNLLLSFTLTATCLEKGWGIADLSKSPFYVLTDDGSL